jgi:hypothetical protein
MCTSFLSVKLVIKHSVKLCKCARLAYVGHSTLTFRFDIAFQINLLIGEPFFSTSILPWHNLHFLYARSEIGHLLARDCTILPVATTIRAIAVDFEHLWKIRSAVGVCEGFDLKIFDSLIEVVLFT